MIPPRRRLLAVAVLLTALTAILHWGLAPTPGFVRTFHPTADFQSAPAATERGTDVSLDFVRESASLPKRSFGVQWRGFWHVADDRSQVLGVTSDDEVQVLVDQAVVIRRNPREQPRTTRRMLTLAKGTHEITIRYRQHGRDMGLGVQPLPAESIFVDPITPLDAMTLSAASWLTAATGIAWLLVALLALVDRAVASGGRGWRLEWATPRVFVRRLRLVAGPALLGPIVLFLVGPFTIHGANPDEFVVPFTAVVWPWTIGAVVVSWGAVLVLSAVACLLSERLTRVIVALLLAAGLLLWAQGTLFLADFGPLYGEALDLTAHTGRVLYELALWGIVLVLAALYARPVSAIAPLLSVMFVGLQVASVVVSLLLGGSRARETGAPNAWSAPPPEMYGLSRSSNVIHIVLDAYLSELFTEAAEEERAVFDRTFAGFAFFPDHLGAFPTTRASMPAMLTGETYRNAETFAQFRARTIQQRSIATVLAEHGYDARSVTFQPSEHPSSMPDPASAVRYTIPTPYGNYEDYVRFTALQLFDFTAFRHVPQVLKASVYNDDAWLWQRGLSANTLGGQRSRMVRPSNHAAFLTEMADRLTAGADRPVYQFIHVALPHPPLVLDAGCNFIPRASTTRGPYAAQSRCAITVVGRLLDRLRVLGIYDQSAVVLTADHGWDVSRPDHPLAGVATPAGDLQSVALTAMPLLAIKPKGASGPLRVSMAQTAITDIPATIADLAGLPAGLFPGESAMRMSPEARRPRSFAFHSWRNADWRRAYMDALHIFAVEGPIHEPASWRFQQTVVDPTGRQEKQ